MGNSTSQRVTSGLPKHEFPQQACQQIFKVKDPN